MDVPLPITGNKYLMSYVLCLRPPMTEAEDDGILSREDARFCSRQRRGVESRFHLKQCPTPWTRLQGDISKELPTHSGPPKKILKKSTKYRVTASLDRHLLNMLQSMHCCHIIMLMAPHVSCQHLWQLTLNWIFRRFGILTFALKSCMAPW